MSNAEPYAAGGLIGNGMTRGLIEPGERVFHADGSINEWTGERWVSVPGNWRDVADVRHRGFVSRMVEAQFPDGTLPEIEGNGP